MRNWRWGLVALLCSAIFMSIHVMERQTERISDMFFFSVKLFYLNPGSPILLSSEAAATMKINCADGGFQSVGDLSSTLNKVSTDGDAELLGNVEDHAIDNLLPNDEYQLLAGIIDIYDRSSFPNQLEDSEEYDIFGSGGGLELESDAPDNWNRGVSRICLSDSLGGNGVAQYSVSNRVGYLKQVQC